MTKVVVVNRGDRWEFTLSAQDIARLTAYAAAHGLTLQDAVQRAFEASLRAIVEERAT